MSIYIGEVPDIWPKVLGLDLEAQGTDPFGDLILSVALSDGKDVWIFLKNIHDLTVLNPMLEDNSITKVVHNAVYDLKMMAMDDELTSDSQRVYCTMIGESIIDAGRGRKLDLQSVLFDRLDIYVEKETRMGFIGRKTFDIEPPTDEEIKYIADDPLHLPAIRQQQINEMVRDKLIDTAILEMPVIPAVVELELGGIALDIELWYEQANKMLERMAEIEEQFKELVGRDFVMLMPATSKGKDCWRWCAVDPDNINENQYEVYREEKPERPLKDNIEELNFGAPLQMKALIRDYYGVPITTANKHCMEAIVNGIIPSMFTEAGWDGPNIVLDDSHVHLQALAAMLVEHGSLSKLVGFDYPKYINEHTGKIHPSYFQLPSWSDDIGDKGASTGRFSSANPNLQNVPRPKGEINLRRIFRADSDDFYILCCDWAQQEPRIMAELCGDLALIQACNSQDVYLEVAKILFKRDDLTKASEERFLAKTFFLAVMYGSGDDTLAKQTGRSVQECGELKQALFKAFPGLKKFDDDMRRQMKLYGFVRTLKGRKRYIDEKSYQAENQAVNSPVQGSGADMFKMALVDIYQYLTKERKCGKIHPKTRLWNIVHDEIILHVHKDDLEVLQVKIKDIMEDAGKRLCPHVSHLAEAAYDIAWDKH